MKRYIHFERFFYSVVLLSLPLLSNGKGIKVYDLQCEGMENHIGIDTTAPFFGWKITSTKRGSMQYAYQILVASDSQRLDRHSDLWNSGKVISSQNTFVNYKGKPLSSAFKYYWKVKVWINGPESSWSETSYFITGILHAHEWDNSRWIAFEALPDSLKLYPGDPNINRAGNIALKRAVVPYFRCAFFINKPIASAYAFVCGLGQYDLFLNGKKNGDDFLNPSWTDYSKKCFYNSFDITSQLHTGANAVSAIVAPGFTYINKERYRKFLIAEGYPMLRMKIVIRYQDGTVGGLVTNDKWKTMKSPVTFSSIYGGEDYDANLKQTGWNQPLFNDSCWKKVKLVNGPGGILRSQECCPMKIERIFHPLNINTGREKVPVYDFGQNCSGILRLKVTGPKGYQIRIIPSELLDKEGLPDQHATGQPYYFSYILNGKGTEEWQPKFSYYGMRYAGIEVYAPDGKRVISERTVTINELLLLHTQNAAPSSGSFACSDTLFNKIFQLIHWGISNNMAGVATDCPHREKLGWLEQSHLMGPSIMYNYDILNFYKKIIDDMRESQLTNGLVPDIAPEFVVFSDGFRDSPEWGSACILLPWYLYKWYGDKDVLKKSYPMMKKYLAYLGTRANNHLLLYGLNDWLEIPKPPTPEGLTASAFYIWDAKILERVSKIIRDGKNAQACMKLSENIYHAFNRKFFNIQTCIYGSGSQTSYALPLYFGMVPEKYKQRMVNNFKNTLVSGGEIQKSGDVGNRFLIQALAQNGMSWLLFNIENKTDTPGYGYQLKKGATSLAESWDASTDLSQDHMGMGHLMEWLFGGLAGISQQPQSYGFKKILIAPQFVKEIQWVKSSYNSINGKIALRWNVSNSYVHLNVTIPANSTAQIKIPISDYRKIKVNGKEAIQNQEVKIVTHTKNEVILETGSGTYELNFNLRKSFYCH